MRKVLLPEGSGNREPRCLLTGVNRESPGQGHRAGWCVPLHSWAPGLVMLREGPEERSALTLFTALAPVPPALCGLPGLGEPRGARRAFLAGGIW